MGLFDFFKKPNPEAIERQAARERRLAEIHASLSSGIVPAAIRTRLEGARGGTLPWTATLTPAELMIARSHGLKPIATVSATCWLHYGWSWTNGHSEGWSMALRRLREEAWAAGANAVLDVKMRTIASGPADSMDFSLVGTAVHRDGLPPSDDPIVATVPALEFVKLLEADVVPTGLAVGAHYEWLNDWRLNTTNLKWMGNIESQQLSALWETVRQRAHAQLRSYARSQGNGVLAHLNFSQMFEHEGEGTRQYLARHIVVATTVDARPGTTLPHNIEMVVDMHAGSTPLTGTAPHHQSYASNEVRGAI
jgi:hypothetical protein